MEPFRKEEAMNVRRTIVTSAAALGVLAGSTGIASAMSSGSGSDPALPAAEADEMQGSTVENDGIQHDFEGEEVGENGDGVAEANEADEADEADDAEADEGDDAEDDEADDAEVDGIDHEFEGEEVGENGNGIPEADDANEAPEVAPSN